MATSAYLTKALLDWALGGATPTRPTNYWVGLSLGLPNSTASSAAQPARLSFSAAAAGTPTSSGTSTNAAGCTFAFTTAQVISGWYIADASVGGNMLFYGALNAVSTMASGDSLRCAAGNFVVTMS